MTKAVEEIARALDPGAFGPKYNDEFLDAEMESRKNRVRTKARAILSTGIVKEMVEALEEVRVAVDSDEFKSVFLAAHIRGHRYDGPMMTKFRAVLEKVK